MSLLIHHLYNQVAPDGAAILEEASLLETGRRDAALPETDDPRRLREGGNLKSPREVEALTKPQAYNRSKGLATVL